MFKISFIWRFLKLKELILKFFISSCSTFTPINGTIQEDLHRPPIHSLHVSEHLMSKFFNRNSIVQKLLDVKAFWYFFIDTFSHGFVGTQSCLLIADALFVVYCIWVKRNLTVFSEAALINFGLAIFRNTFAVIVLNTDFLHSFVTRFNFPVENDFSPAHFDMPENRNIICLDFVRCDRVKIEMVK